MTVRRLGARLSRERTAQRRVKSAFSSLAFLVRIGRSKGLSVTSPQALEVGAAPAWSWGRFLSARKGHPFPLRPRGSLPRNRQSRSREAVSFVSGHETILRHGRSHFLKPRRYPETGA